MSTAPTATGYITAMSAWRDEERDRTAGIVGNLVH